MTIKVFYVPSKRMKKTVDITKDLSIITSIPLAMFYTFFILVPDIIWY